MTSSRKTVQGHYSRHGELTARILAALEVAGKDTTDLGLEDLTPLDQFHLRGHQVTREIAEELGLTAGQHLLDVGCGVGGPARMLAGEYGVTAVGIDLTEVFCRTAAELSILARANPAPSFVCADATNLPFPAASFDVVWTQHAAMNIPDKPGLYGECFRVCRPGGKFLLYDVVEGLAGAPYYPVPWAGAPSGSFLASAEAVRVLVQSAGFDELVFRDMTGAAIDANRKRQRQMKMVEPGEPLALGPHLLMGPEFPQMIANVGRGLEEGRLGVALGIFERPA